MVGAAVIVGVILVWLASRRVEFCWRTLWLFVIIVGICAGSASNAVHVTGDIGGGLYEIAHGVGALLNAL